MPRFRRPRSPVHAARRGAAAVLAVAALVLALRPDPAPADDGPARVPVAVAAADLAAGRVLTASDVRVARLPSDLVPGGTARDPADLVGRALAGSVRAGEPLTDVRLVGSGLTALLAPHQVAAPVRLADLAVAALVRAGDRVDVLATPPDAGAAQVVVSGALVLAPGGSARAPSTADPTTGLLLIAVDGPTATLLAAAAASSTLTVTLPRPP